MGPEIPVHQYPGWKVISSRRRDEWMYCCFRWWWKLRAVQIGARGVVSRKQGRRAGPYIFGWVSTRKDHMKVGCRSFMQIEPETGNWCIFEEVLHIFEPIRTMELRILMTSAAECPTLIESSCRPRNPAGDGEYALFVTVCSRYRAFPRLSLPQDDDCDHLYDDPSSRRGTIAAFWATASRRLLSLSPARLLTL